MLKQRTANPLARLLLLKFASDELNLKRRAFSPLGEEDQ